MKLFRGFGLVAALCLGCLGGEAAATAGGSIVITGPHVSFADTCSGAHDLRVDIIANEPAGYSDTYTISAPGFPGYLWAGGENGPWISPSDTYGINGPSSWGMNAAPNTPVTATIIVYNAPDLGGKKVHSSAMTWNCTTGAVISIVNVDYTQDSAAPVPTLAQWAQYALVLLLLGLGGRQLRRMQRR